jgi:outer membrane protein OmpA-like peptidoglycan-associated protein
MIRLVLAYMGGPLKRNSFLLFVLLLVALAALFFRFAPSSATRSAKQLARNVGDSASQMVGAVASAVVSPRGNETQASDAPVNVANPEQVEYPVLTKQTEAEVVAEAQRIELAQAVALKAEEAKALEAVGEEVAATNAVENTAGNAAQRASDLLTQAIKAADEAKAQMLIAQKELRSEAKASLNLKRAQQASTKNEPQIKSTTPKQASAPQGKDQELEAELARNPVHFNWMKSTLDDESQARLAKIARAIEKNPNADIQITGHTDNNGKPELNKWLGLIRARRVREQLIAQGINPKRLSVASEGASNPVASNDTALGRWKNRRVEFALSAK